MSLDSHILGHSLVLFRDMSVHVPKCVCMCASNDWTSLQKCFSWSISWSMFCEMLKQVVRGKIGLCSNHVWALFSMLFIFSPPNYEHQWITWNGISQILWFTISRPLCHGVGILVSNMESFSGSIKIQMARNSSETASSQIEIWDGEKWV